MSDHRIYRWIIYEKIIYTMYNIYNNTWARASIWTSENDSWTLTQRNSIFCILYYRYYLITVKCYANSRMYVYTV